MKILIIGGTRYIGLRLYKDLKKEKSLKIYTLSRSKFINKNHIICDRNNYYKLEKVFKKINPEIILDMVNFSGQNSKDIKNLFEKKKIPSLKHYIVISSFFVYEYFSLKKYREKILTTKQKIEKDSYTKNKVEMEKNLYSSKIFDITTIVRFPFIFSFDDYTGRFQKICDISKKVKKLNIKGKKFSMISKDFAVKCLKYLIYSKPVKIIDFSSKGCVNLNKILNTINKKFKFSEKNKENYYTKEFPYTTKNDLCLNTKKVNFKENTLNAIMKESNLYFSKVYK